ncbi:Asp-tRNA(Asn)/Glu-tRNA(Gln) amidotransferase subunit GatC [Candidatus Bandiella euplotis]|uniref:Aspartyl/glutamyl-tRNA(Asn/Gln) amidotransferase subunit C n=1 Tax=Candidatus Bandiella euplotis TaxID=1664265 RepID=A0ABZ0UKF6_9RICK|nr:Asp-tRNA(Asn)/Glu-tRNA(Gln) amidotransferase subunit GatC [Candidatus Bandiella woodruffii]WPX96608.1 Glutamyl-tRNA(Gln) amidotransferase subunit C [Candidatus Bandiella woodruffii]
MDNNRAEVKKIMQLASLSFVEDDLAQYQKDLNNIIDLFDKLKEVKTDGVEPLLNTLDDDLRLREDLIIKENSREDIFKNAPKSKYGFFTVPKMIE